MKDLYFLFQRLWGYYAVVAGLLLTTTAAEKKVNLEDIERDNLRSEGRTGSSKGTLQQKSYQVKPETDSEDYRSSSHQYEAARGFGSYSSRDKPGHHYHVRYTLYIIYLQRLIINILY